MKAILMSIRPQYVAKILNGEKTIEIRKKFPKDYVGWVYIYVTKEKRHYCYHAFESDVCTMENIRFFPMTKCNGKVVARFWCDKVEKIRSYLEPEQWYMTNDLGGCGLLQKSCLTFEELDDYLLSGSGYAIHITNLEIFDKPMSLNAFYYAREPRKDLGLPKNWKQIVTRPPQSFFFIEV